MDEMRRMHYVSERYGRLQGLRIVPLGGVFVASAAWRLGWLPLPGGPNAATAWFVGGIGVAIVVSFLIRATYHRTFGQADAFFRTSGSLPLVTILAACVALLWAQNARGWVVSLPLLFLGACLAYTGLAHNGLRRHYIGVAAGVAALASLEPLGVPFEMRQVALDAVIGSGLILAGIGDDLVLRRYLHPPTSPHAGAA